MKIFTAFSLLLLTQASWSGLQAGSVKGSLGEKLDNQMNLFVQEGYSGAVLVASQGNVVLQKGYGFADRERQIPNTPDTLFHVASVGKIFTAAAILRLEMDGKLKTDDLISKYLGPFPGDKSRAKIHHLLVHTSGLTVAGAQLEYGSRRSFVQSLKDAPMGFKPGAGYRYSNAEYTMLAAIVEEVTGHPFEQYLEKNLFKPAGMTQTGFPWDTRFADAPVAVGYQGDKLESLKPTPRVGDIWGNRGPGNVLTTVTDLYKWIVALRNNQVLSEKAKAKMFTAYANGDEGYGWHVTKTERGTKMMRRGGGRPDFEAEVQWYVDENVIVIFTVNNDLNLRRRIAPALGRVIWGH